MRCYQCRISKPICDRLVFQPAEEINGSSSRRGSRGSRFQLRLPLVSALSLYFVAIIALVLLAYLLLFAMVCVLLFAHCFALLGTALLPALLLPWSLCFATLLLLWSCFALLLGSAALALLAPSLLSRCSMCRVPLSSLLYTKELVASVP